MRLLNSLREVLVAVANLCLELALIIAPWVPLLMWIAFWLCAVNWRQLYPVLMKGGMIGVILSGLMITLVWSVISVPEAGVHRVFGLEVSNLVSKLVAVTSLIVIAFLCGSVQLSGICGSLCSFENEKILAKNETSP